VSASSTATSNVHFISAAVQGTVLKADDVEVAVESVFTKLMPQRLQELSEKEFSSFVDSLRQELLEPPMAPSEEVAHFWSPVQQGGRCFQLRGAMLRYLNSSSLTRQRLVDVWAGLVTPKDGVRRKVTVKYFAGEVPPRPSLEDAKKSWKSEGLFSNATDLLLREREKTLILDHVDSKVRADVAKEGGYFPQDIICSLQGE